MAEIGGGSGYVIFFLLLLVRECVFNLGGCVFKLRGVGLVLPQHNGVRDLPKSESGVLYPRAAPQAYNELPNRDMNTASIISIQ
jgi:hypothetical protein